MRKRVFEIIEKSNDNDMASSFYDYFMIVVIFISLVPLAFKNTSVCGETVDTYGILS